MSTCLVWGQFGMMMLSTPLVLSILSILIEYAMLGIWQYAPVLRIVVWRVLILKDTLAFSIGDLNEKARSERGWMAQLDPVQCKTLFERDGETGRSVVWEGANLGGVGFFPSLMLAILAK